MTETRASYITGVTTEWFDLGAYKEPAREIAGFNFQGATVGEEVTINGVRYRRVRECRDCPLMAPKTIDKKITPAPEIEHLCKTCFHWGPSDGNTIESFCDKHGYRTRGSTGCDAWKRDPMR